MCSIECHPFDLVDFLGPKAPVDARGQLQRIFAGSALRPLDGELDMLTFANLGPFDGLEDAVLEDCLNRGLHCLTAFRTVQF